ncbi:hypothetical protein BDV95DRAFT_563484 [Massariosphaeria phaeospora]|uniref:Ankyrin repeat-containing domain protein n=1 Tax=Massariosphaeria phaeospora TaxID=100035 RepID=A0A7C8MTS9_9PLEO|nr:hypothetical protein BDV95DRAFT_563484 [Massariosphaeria phaeospora]
MTLNWANTKLRQLYLSLFKSTKTYDFTTYILARLGGYNPFDHLPGLISADDFQPVHAAALLGFQSICRQLVDDGCDLSQVSPVGTPLECCLSGPHCLFSEAIGPCGIPGASDTALFLIEAGASCQVHHSYHSFSLLAKAGPAKSPAVYAALLRHGMPFCEDARKARGDVGFYEEVVAQCGEEYLSSEKAADFLKFITSLRIAQESANTSKHPNFLKGWLLR